jgi:hypothetical protein
MPGEALLPITFVFLGHVLASSYTRHVGWIQDGYTSFCPHIPDFLWEEQIKNQANKQDGPLTILWKELPSIITEKGTSTFTPVKSSSQ